MEFKKEKNNIWNVFILRFFFLTYWKQLELVPGEAKVHDVGEKGGQFRNKTHFMAFMCYTMDNQLQIHYEFETYILILMLRTP